MMRWLAIVGLVIAMAVGIWRTHPAPRPGVRLQVSEAYASISGLVADDLVVIAVDFDPAGVPELSPFVRLALDAALLRGARVVTMSLSPQGAMLAERYLREALADRHAVYGRDAMNLGYIEGRGTAVHVLGMPLQRAVTRDHAGDAIADLPLASRIARLDDAELVIVAANGQASASDWILQSSGRFARALLMATSSDVGAELSPFYAAGQLAGLLSGARDVAAFADLCATDPRLRDAASMRYVERLAEQMRGQRWAHLALVMFLVVGQGVTLWRGRKQVAK